MAHQRGISRRWVRSDGRSGAVGARGEPGARAEGEREAAAEAEAEVEGVPLTPATPSIALNVSGGVPSACHHPLHHSKCERRAPSACHPFHHSKCEWRGPLCLPPSPLSLKMRVEGPLWLPPPPSLEMQAEGPHCLPPPPPSLKMRAEGPLWLPPPPSLKMRVEGSPLPATTPSVTLGYHHCQQPPKSSMMA